MIVFFTFLTFYSAYFDKVKDCGCFGDAMPLTPWQSFYKDAVLLGLILLLFFNRKLITPILAPVSHRWIIFLSFMLCFIFAYYVLMHLPAIDFRAYKVGNNLLEEMKIPEGAKKASYEYKWKFLQDGEEVIIKNTGAYPNLSGEYIGVETTLISEGFTPRIPDFSILKDDENITKEILSNDKLLLIVAYDLRSTEREGFANIKILSEQALKKGYTVVGLTASGDDMKEEIISKYNLNFEFYQSDETVLKTIVRSNPGILTLRKATVIQKKHWGDASEINL